MPLASTSFCPGLLRHLPCVSQGHTQCLLPTCCPKEHVCFFAQQLATSLPHCKAGAFLSWSLPCLLTEALAHVEPIKPWLARLWMLKDDPGRRCMGMWGDCPTHQLLGYEEWNIKLCISVATFLLYFLYLFFTVVGFELRTSHLLAGTLPLEPLYQLALGGSNLFLPVLPGACIPEPWAQGHPQ
jgi:hypothetical protein